ncbi:hypothetical protein PTT_18996 [Pyrenophora teres f. teres 0-1]|uniref:DUF7587 domain-containing protein n=2 Tax=Pyrenophora teres f. teres TaxID=97479 RepID=E3S7Y7_PYRTT|nr:hypothetical protein PTT_18996 [Pyrenophora teres f. teres 0-1]KAE8846250.1 hypothetical protein HRS9139_00817 [Pyrenophora teres f. teres]KAE8848390.1 hypothetical protein PTNB85_02233 [Pyrenophora teres f. teres]KAE8868315.1 hypothetical protein PTNB29_02226 [Pyrenophora teres f. teres]CAE7023341.1 hypothetical protein PTTW11_03571 [Pyrenophora teres f. teres]
MPDTISSNTSAAPSTTSLSPPPSPSPTSIPALVYRVHRPTSQTRYTPTTGFSAKNHTTILNYTSCLSRFSLAHLNQQTNISSPFISVYDNRAHADAVAKHFARSYGEETCVVTVDTRHLARGPVFRAKDLLKEGMGGTDEWLHWGEYLVMYRIPPQAIREEVKVGGSGGLGWEGVGVGSGVVGGSGEGPRRCRVDMFGGGEESVPVEWSEYRDGVRGAAVAGDGRSRRGGV